MLRNVVANNALLILALGASTLGAASCAATLGGSSEDAVCNPGDNVFCRCRGGTAGTKECLPSGRDFGDCETASGACTEEPPPKGDDYEPPPPAAGELLAPCMSDAECGVGMACPMGYCTKPCTSYEQCAPPGPAAAGDCVMFGGQGTCVPYCTTEQECGIYGLDSHCSYTPDALPAWDVVVCANWADAVSVPPVGYSCTGDDVCNLGWMGAERVCDGASCAEGCHVQSDCADPEQPCTSTSPEELGACGAPPVDDGDGCPGIAVELSLLNNQQFHSSNTALLSLPSEADGVGDCAPSAPGLETEEIIYQVQVVDSGILDVIVMPEPGFDAVAYARIGACTSGTQLACSDYTFDGEDEQIVFEVFAGEVVTVVVDGWSGSTGPYSVLFSLTP